MRKPSIDSAPGPLPDDVDGLLGAALERTDEPLAVPEPVVERALPGGRGHFHAVRDRAVLRVNGVGAFEVTRGERVRFRLDDGVTAADAAAFLHGTVASLLVAQRGQFALHASVAEIGARGVALCGRRGVGKSTTVLRLAQRGHRLVTDDISVLTLGDEVMVRPLAYPPRVLPDTARRLRLDTSRATRVASQAKLTMPPPRQVPLPLGTIVLLAVGEEASTRQLHGAEAAWMLVVNAYRCALLRPLYEAEMFAWAAAVAARVPVHAVTRAAAGWTVDAVADGVERLAA